MKTLEIQTWIDMFDPSEINVDKIEGYISFIQESIKNRDGDRYSEWHHVMPRCIDPKELYGTELVHINGSAHFKVHLKLVECFNGKLKSKLAYALVRMKEQVSSKGEEITPEEWEEARRIYSESIKGSGNPFYGKKHSDESKQKISEANLLRDPEEVQKWASCNKGRRCITNGESLRYIESDTPVPEGWTYGSYKRSSETCKKLSESKKGKSPVYSPESKARIIAALKSRVITEETRKKLSEISKGRVVSEDTRRVLSQSLSKQNTGRIWMNDGVSNKFVKPEDVQSLLDKGYNKGRLISNSSHKGSVFITDGVTNKLLHAGQEIPEGWRRGMVHK